MTVRQFATAYLLNLRAMFNRPVEYRLYAHGLVEYMPEADTLGELSDNAPARYEDALDEVIAEYGGDIDGMLVDMDKVVDDMNDLLYSWMARD